MTIRHFKLIVIVLLLAFSSARAADSILYMNEDFSKMQDVRGEILEETYKQVVIETVVDGEKVKKVIKPNHIVKIAHDERAPNLGVGKIREKDNQWKEAIESYRTSLESADSAEWAKAEAVHSIGRIQFMLGYQEDENSYYEKAIETFSELTKKFPQSRWAPDGWVQIGQAYVRLGKLDEARTQFKAALDPKWEYPELYTLRARVGLARILVLEAQKLPKRERMEKLNAAVSSANGIMDSVEKTTDPNLREFRYEALLVKAEALLELGEFDVENRRRAEEICQDIVIGSKRVDLKAHASNFRGDSLRKRGLNREAYLSYVKTVSLYFQEKYAHQKALYWAAICAARYGLENKAGEYLRDLKTDYSESEWVRKLTEDLPAAIDEGKRLRRR